MPSYRVDTSRPPLLRVHFDGVVDDDAFQRYIDELKAWVDRGERYAMLVDATSAGVPGSAQRRMQTDFMESYQQKLKRLCVGAAFVIPAPLVRGALIAMLWVQPLPFPHKVVADVAAADAWCLQQLNGAGPPL